MTLQTTIASLGHIEALAVLREQAVANGHTMTPAEWYEGTLSSRCTQCRTGCSVYWFADDLVVRYVGTNEPCVPDSALVQLREGKLL